VVGGYERLCFQVASALSQRGHQIHVLTSDFGDKQEIYEGQTVRRRLRLLADSDDIYKPFGANSDTINTINISNIKEFLQQKAAIKPDIIFCWNMFFFDESLLKSIIDCGVPTLLFLTDNWLIAASTPERIHQHFARHVSGDEPFTFTASVNDRYFSAGALFGSEFVRALYHSCGYAFSHEQVVHNGVSPPNQDPGLARDRRTTYRANEFRLLFAGRFVELKGPQDCVAALPLIQNILGSDVDVRLTMVGDNQDARFWDRLRRQIKESGMEDKITMLDTVPEGELIDLFNTHDAYLFPSHYEPFALTLILAMACGLPVVGSDVGGNTEIIHDRRTGLLYRKGNIGELAGLTAELYRDADLRLQVSERGRRFARKFTFSRMVTQLESVLLEHAGKPSSALAAV
jgi:glycosyltransferase involved in cell wall biosynthesis